MHSKEQRTVHDRANGNQHQEEQELWLNVESETESDDQLTKRKNELFPIADLENQFHILYREAKSSQDFRLYQKVVDEASRYITAEGSVQQTREAYWSWRRGMDAIYYLSTLTYTLYGIFQQHPVEQIAQDAAIVLVISYIVMCSFALAHAMGRNESRWERQPESKYSFAEPYATLRLRNAKLQEAKTHLQTAKKDFGYALKALSIRSSSLSNKQLRTAAQFINSFADEQQWLTK